MGCATEQSSDTSSLVDLSGSPEKMRDDFKLLKNKLIGSSAAKLRAIADNVHLSVLQLIQTGCSSAVLEQALAVLAVLVHHAKPESLSLEDQRKLCKAVSGQLLVGSLNRTCRTTGLHILSDLLEQLPTIINSDTKADYTLVVEKFLAENGEEGVLAAKLAADLARAGERPVLPEKHRKANDRHLSETLEETVLNVVMDVLMSIPLNFSALEDLTRLELLLQAAKPYAQTLDTMAVGLLSLAPEEDRDGSEQERFEIDMEPVEAAASLPEIAKPSEPAVLRLTSADNREELSIRSFKATHLLFKFTDSQSLALRLAAIELVWAVNAPSRELARRLLPLMVVGLDNQQTRARTASVCAQMCLADELGAVMLLKRGYVNRLVSYLAETEPLSATAEKVFLILAAVSSHSDELRSETYNARVGFLLLRTLETGAGSVNDDDDGDAAVVAACLTLRCLSRSVELLSTRLASEAIVDALVNIVRAGSLASSRLRTAVLAVICNLILECSPAQKMLLDRGILTILTDSTRAFDEEQRVNAIWALKHALYLASDETKMETMRLLGINGLLRILNDPSNAVVEQALGLVRNFLFEFSTGHAYLANEVGDEDLAMLLKDKLKGPDAVVETTLYVLVHFVMYNDSPGKLVLWCELIADNIALLLDSQSSSIQLAAIMLVMAAVDAAKTDTGDSMATSCALADLLEHAGVRQILQRCCDSRLLSVSERAFAAKEVFDSLLSYRTNYRSS